MQISQSFVEFTAAKKSYKIVSAIFFPYGAVPRDVVVPIRRMA